jgi:magnesium chelatase family protein
MIAIVKSTVLHGLDGQIVEVEVDVSGGLPSFDIVGLPDASVREAKDRVRAAIKNSGFEFPVKRITVNLAPADLKKEGPLYDLPIAVGILAATEQIDAVRCREFVLMGELSLNGALRGVTGVLPNTLVAQDARHDKVIVPLENAPEAALAEGVQAYPFQDLVELAGFLKGETEKTPYIVNVAEMMRCGDGEYPDFADVRGHHAVKRALEVAASGGHNVIMVGSPGSGKTMLARRLPGILPDLTFQEAIEVTKIYSLTGLLPQGQPLLTRRPFRSPHHTASSTSIIGGGRIPKPGEVSLAHHGILFLDEIPEFHKDALEALRQPLEDGLVTVSRIHASYTYPAGLTLVAACNPCPCGFYGDPSHDCSCTPYQVQRYISRLSGPLLDRIDIQIEVPRLPFEEISSDVQAESSRKIKDRVDSARERQRVRMKLPACNARMGPKEVRRYCKLSPFARTLLREAFKSLSMSARAHDRILKVARTIADLDGDEIIQDIHVAEAVPYRSLDRIFV